nr:hypothetical protein [Tanacetum cinerariifolium]
QSGNPTFSSHPKLTSLEVQDDIFDLEGGNVLPEKLLDLNSTKDLLPPLHANPLSGSTTYSSSPNPLLEELTDELALITFPPKYDNDLQFDVESDLKEIEFFLHQDILMFTDEHALDYSSALIFNEYDDDFFEVESDTEHVYDDPFDCKGEKIKKIKESKLLIDELDLPCDFLPSEYDSFISQDFSRVDALPSTNNEDKVFNPCILSQEKPFEIITRVVQYKNLAISNASLVLEDFDPPLYEPLFYKEVLRIVGIRKLLSAVEVTAADMEVSTADSSSSLALLELPSALILLPSALVLLPSAMSFTTSLSIGSCITIPLALGVVDVVTVVDVVLVALTCTLSSFTIAFLFFKEASALANVISSIEITGVVAAALTSTPTVVTTSLSEENLKLPTEDQVILEEPASSTKTLSSLQNLEKELSFTDQFFLEKTQEEKPKKTNAESEKVSKAVDEIVTDAVDWAMQALLRARFSDFPANSLERDYSNQLLVDLDEARKKKRKKRDLSRTPYGSPPPQPPSPSPLAGAFGAPGTSGASRSS